MDPDPPTLPMFALWPRDFSTIFTVALSASWDSHVMHSEPFQETAEFRTVYLRQESYRMLSNSWHCLPSNLNCFKHLKDVLTFLLVCLPASHLFWGKMFAITFFLSPAFPYPLHLLLLLGLFSYFILPTPYK